MWDLTRWFCPARSCCVACVLLGVSLRALALCVSCWESAGPLCFTGSRCMLWGSAPLGAGVGSSHHSLGSQGISWELVHATSALSGWESACHMLAMSHCPLLCLPGCHTEPTAPVWPSPTQPSRSPAPRLRIRDTWPQLALPKVPVCSGHQDVVAL